MAQPDFQALATGLQTVAILVSRLPNLPIFNENNAILNQLRDMRAASREPSIFKNQYEGKCKSYAPDCREYAQKCRSYSAMNIGFTELKRRMDAAFVPDHSISNPWLIPRSGKHGGTSCCGWKG